MQKFFEYFEIEYAPELESHFNNGTEEFRKKGNAILDFEKLNIYTYTKDHLGELRDEIAKDERNIIYCYFLNSVLKTNDARLINSVCKPKYSLKSEIFDCLPLFSLLYEVPAMCKRLEDRDVPRDVIDATCNMFENQLQDFIDLYGHYGISAYVTWLLAFINNKIIRIGRFNIEITNFDNACVYRKNSTISVVSPYNAQNVPTDAEIIANPGDTVISVHIPSGGRLDFDRNTEDLKRASQIVTECFGEFKLFYCNSWLLDPMIKKVIGKETNMTRFADRFTRYPTESNGTSVFNYLYLTTDTENIDALPEDTSMQREIKKHLLSGGKILNYQGVFTKEDLL